MQPRQGWYFNPRSFSQGGASLTLGFVMEHRWCSFRNSMFCGFCGINMTLGKISAMETGVSYHV
jgi:hypothetical protein